MRTLFRLNNRRVFSDDASLLAETGEISIHFAMVANRALSPYC